MAPVPKTLDVSASSVPRHLDDAAVVPPQHFAHAVLKTRDIEEAIRWFGRVIGAQVVQRSKYLAFLSYDDEHHRIALVQVPRKQQLPEGALDHIAYTYKDLGQLLQTFARLKKEGITPFWTINHGVTTSMYYRHPDGYGVELQVDNFSSKTELMAYIQSGVFEQNQIGVEYDADALLDRYLRGDPILDLLRIGKQPTLQKAKL